MKIPEAKAEPSVLFEELRFAKKQQWYVAASVVGLNAGLLALSRGITLSGIEVLAAVFCMLLIAGGGGAVLCHLQDHLQSVRVGLNPQDNLWARTTDVVYPLSVVIAASAVVCVYLLRFPHATC